MKLLSILLFTTFVMAAAVPPSEWSLLTQNVDVVGLAKRDDTCVAHVRHGKHCAIRSSTAISNTLAIQVKLHLTLRECARHCTCKETGCKSFSWNNHGTSHEKGKCTFFNVSLKTFDLVPTSSLEDPLFVRRGSIISQNMR